MDTNKEMDKNKDKKEQSIADKSIRSVFVGNIPYDATEDMLKDIFSQVGPVLSFKLQFDGVSGKSMGYGFCEYKDQTTASNAIEDLCGYEIGGRSLRVHNACDGKYRTEMQALKSMREPLVENPYGEAVPPEEAPDVISKAVASLPPEKMFDLMKEMKACIQNNPNEARNMLLQNPQLAYALLQAQINMGIVDPATAVTMLHPTNRVPPCLRSLEKSSAAMSQSIGMPSPPVSAAGNIPNSVSQVPQLFPGLGVQDIDLRSLNQAQVAYPDPRFMSQRNAPVLYQAVHGVQPPIIRTKNFNRDPRTNYGMFHPNDPQRRLVLQRQPPKPPVPTAAQPSHRAPIAGIPTGPSNEEKAAMIKQVLELTDEQIAKLTPKQKMSILELKEQIMNNIKK